MVTTYLTIAAERDTTWEGSRFCSCKLALNAYQVGYRRYIMGTLLTWYITCGCAVSTTGGVTQMSGEKFLLNNPQRFYQKLPKKASFRCTCWSRLCKVVSSLFHGNNSSTETRNRWNSKERRRACKEGERKEEPCSLCFIHSTGRGTWGRTGWFARCPDSAFGNTTDGRPIPVLPVGSEQAGGWFRGRLLSWSMLAPAEADNNLACFFGLAFSARKPWN